MKPISLILSILLTILFSTRAWAQEYRQQTASFCGYPAPDRQTNFKYSREMIDNCDLVIDVDDPGVSILSFDLTIIPWALSEGITKVHVNGNRVPAQYRTQLLEKTNHFFIEHIKATLFDGSDVFIRPMNIRMNSN